MTKDQGAKLFEGQQVQIRAVQESSTLVAGRVAACEMTDGYLGREQERLRADLKDIQLRSGAIVRR